MLQIHAPGRIADSPVPVLDVVTVRRPGVVWLGIRGELDLTSLPCLESALDQVDLHGVREVHLLTARLTFCDVGGVRELVRFAEQVHRRGGQVRTHGAGPILEKVVRLMGADGVLALD